MKDQTSLKVDMLIIDRSIKDKVGLTASSFKRKDDSRPGLAIISQKLEDFCNLGNAVSPVIPIMITTTDH